jgi:hypothetical protein
MGWRVQIEWVCKVILNLRISVSWTGAWGPHDDMTSFQCTHARDDAGLAAIAADAGPTAIAADDGLAEVAVDGGDGGMNPSYMGVEESVVQSRMKPKALPKKVVGRRAVCFLALQCPAHAAESRVVCAHT